MRLTTDLLKKIILKEANKLSKEKSANSVSAKEVDADELADTLEKHIDYAKALNIEESRLKKRLAKIAETRTRISKLLDL
jgi:hypothetical protein